MALSMLMVLPPTQGAVFFRGAWKISSKDGLNPAKMEGSASKPLDFECAVCGIIGMIIRGLGYVVNNHG